MRVCIFISICRQRENGNGQTTMAFYQYFHSKHKTQKAVNGTMCKDGKKI